MLRPVKFVKSDLLNIDGYLYSKNNTRKDITYWKCTKNKELHCSGFSKTVSKDNGIFVMSDISKIQHNHVTDSNCRHIESG